MSYSVGNVNIFVCICPGSIPTPKAGLSTGAIIGIAIGCLFTILLIVIVFVVIKKRRDLWVLNHDISHSNIKFGLLTPKKNWHFACCYYRPHIRTSNACLIVICCYILPTYDTSLCRRAFPLHHSLHTCTLTSPDGVVLSGRVGLQKIFHWFLITSLPTCALTWNFFAAPNSHNTMGILTNMLAKWNFFWEKVITQYVWRYFGEACLGL